MAVKKADSSIRPPSPMLMGRRHAASFIELPAQQPSPQPMPPPIPAIHGSANSTAMPAIKRGVLPPMQASNSTAVIQIKAEFLPALPTLRGAKNNPPPANPSAAAKNSIRASGVSIGAIQQPASAAMSALIAQAIVRAAIKPLPRTPSALRSRYTRAALPAPSTSAHRIRDKSSASTGRNYSDERWIG